MKTIDELGISPTPWAMKTWQASDDYGTIVESANHNTVCDCSWSALGDEQGEIDARLIAAAPELYECLRDAVEDMEEINCDPDGCASCLLRDDCKIQGYRYVLAKASGEEVK